MKTKVGLILFMLFFSACNLYNYVTGSDYNTASGYYAIGTIMDGSTNKSFPVYDERIKLSWIENRLNQREINTINRELEEKYKLKITDSLDIFPKGLLLEIADYSALLSNLKQPGNEKLLSLLKNDEKLRILTSLNSYFKDEQANLIKQASVLYLINPSNGVYAIEAVNVDGSKNRIYFSDGVVIQSETQGFCWQLDYRNQPELVDISDRCPKGTREDVNELESIDKMKGIW